MSEGLRVVEVSEVAKSSGSHLLKEISAMPLPIKNAQLTKRETEVARCLAQGLTKSQVAEQLALALQTVRIHCANIKKKWDMPTAETMTLRAEAKRRGYSWNKRNE